MKNGLLDREKGGLRLEAVSRGTLNEKSYSEYCQSIFVNECYF